MAPLAGSTPVHPEEFGALAQESVAQESVAQELQAHVGRLPRDVHRAGFQRARFLQEAAQREEQAVAREAALPASSVRASLAVRS